MLKAEKLETVFSAKIREYRSYSGKTLLRSRQKGSILVGIVITMVVMATLGAGMVFLTTTSTFNELFANNHARAYYLAESGARYASSLLRQDLASGSTLSISLNSPAVTTFTLANNGGQFQIKNMVRANEGSSTLPVEIIFDSVGIVNSGFLQAKRIIRYKIIPANQQGPVSGSPPEMFDRDVGDFNIPKPDLDLYYSPVDMSQVDIKDNPRVQDDEALNLKADAYTMGLKWYANLSMAQLDDIRNNNGDLLSYGAQVKIYDYDEDTNQASHYNIIGISFRLDDSNNATMTDDLDNMYGISFVKITKPGNTGQSDPDWYKSYIHSNAAWNYFSVNNAGKWFVVLWKRIFTGSSPTFTPLAYQKLTSSDSACREGTPTDCTKIKWWSTILVNVEEISGANKITGYLASPESYPRSTTTAVLPIQWANATTVNEIFKPITWTVVGSGTAKLPDPLTFPPDTVAIDIIQDSSLTTSNYEGYTIGDITQTKAREIGLHIFDTSTSAQNIYYDNFYIDLSPSFTGGSGVDGTGLELQSS